MASREYRRSPYIVPGTLRGEMRHVLVIPGTSSDNGARRRQFFKTEREAKTALRNLETAITTRGREAAAAPADLVNDAVRARAKLDEAGIVSSLNEVVAEWLMSREKETRSVTVRVAVEDWLKNPRHHRRKRTQDELERIGGRMVDGFGDTLICNVNPREVHVYCEQYWQTNYNFNVQLQRLRGLFGHAERKGWCSPRLIRDIYQPKSVPRKEYRIGTLTPDEFSRLLKEAEGIDSALVDYLAVLGLAGVRPAEAERLRGEHFQREEHQFGIPSAISKTHLRRLVPLEPALGAWLARPGGFFERVKRNGKDEHLAPVVGLASKFKLAKRRAGFRVQVNGMKEPESTLAQWPGDGLRHTFASAYVTLHPEQIAALIFSFGHAGSLDVLRRHYAGAYDPAQARAWFKVTPPGVKLPEFAVIEGGAALKAVVR